MSPPPSFSQLERALAAGDARALASIPETDLHCHGLLSAPRAVYEQVIGRPLDPPPRRFEDFDDFSRYIVEQLWPALRDPPSVRALARGAFERLVEDGVAYAEMSFDLLLPQAIGLSADFTIFGAGVCDEILALSRMGVGAADSAAVIERGLAEQRAATP